MRERMGLIRHPLFLICLSQFCIFMGMNLVNPVLPLYIASFEVSYTMVGVVLSSFGFSRIFIEIPGGRLMDMVGRKPIIVLGYALTTISHFLAGLARTPLELAVSRMLLGTGSAFILSSSRIYVTEIGTEDQRLRYLSLFQSTSSIAGIVSPTLGGLIAEAIGIRNIFFISTTISIIGVLLVINIRVYERALHSKEKTPWSFLKILEIIKDARIIAISTACFMIFFFFSSIRGTLIPIYGAEVLTLRPFEVGLVFSFLSTTTVVGLLVLTHRLEERLGRAMLLSLSLLTCAVSIVLVSLATDFITLSAFIIPLGIGLSILQPTSWTMISDHTHPKNRGLTMGIARTIADSGHLIGPPLVGGLIDLGQPLLAFYIVAGVLGLASLLTYIVFKNQKVAN